MSAVDNSVDTAINEVPPTSTQTSNHLSDGLDFDSDAGGKISTDDVNVNLNTEENTDLEEGEIGSDSDSDSKNTSSTSIEETGKSSDSSLNKGSPKVREISKSVQLYDSSNRKESKNIGLCKKTATSSKYNDHGVYDRKSMKSLKSPFSSPKSPKAKETFKKSSSDINESEPENRTESESTGKNNGKGKKRQLESDVIMSHNVDEAEEPPSKAPHLESQRSPTQEHVTGKDTVDTTGTQELAGTQELEIIDDLGCVEEGGEEDEAEEDMDYVSDEDLDDNEIYAWLEEGLQKPSAPGENKDTDVPIQREKVVLKEKGHDPFEMLPEGWVVVTHNSGMPMYLHKQSRVCTLSKPYFLGPGSVRKHDIPISAVPCLQYKTELRKEKEKVEKPENPENPTEETTVDRDTPKEASDTFNGETTTSQVSNSTMNTNDTISQNGDNTVNGDSTATTAVPPVKIEYADERKKSLEPQELTHYCQRLFEFNTITVKKFKTWKDRRRHLNTVKKQSRPALPSNTKLITCSIPPEKGEDKPKRKEFILNPSGKSFVCILHEYAQHTLRIQPRYVFRELENSQNPYSATVVIGDVEYGTGYASSKKSAKMAAAKTTLSILIPEMTKVTEEVKEDIEDLSFFDEIKIEDPRVYDLCNKTGQPSPFQILQECLKRNYGMGDTQCKVEVNPLKHQKSEYRLTVGKHTVTVVCKNKREGKQRAAQAILQQLHPFIYSLGSLLRLYGRSAWKCVKEKKNEEHSVTELQSQNCSNKPNTAVLAKLKEEMKKLQLQKDAIKSKGKLRVENSALPGNIASLDL